MEKQDQSTLIPSVLSCLLTEDKETRRWNGHCLDFDIATSGKDPDRAWRNLRAVVRLHVEHCFTHWQKGLTFRASRDEISLFVALKRAQQPVRSEKITFELAPPPTQEHLSSLWIEGIELTEGVGNAQAAAHVQ
ncbi:MAG TPA: hypothetical protein VNE63_05380 [Candidatus Acidoferrales bacterium]|nr:hypothetical protein [Candidatus Acidoferrales bacterium]